MKSEFWRKLYLWAGMTPAASYRSELPVAVCRERLTSVIRPEPNIYLSSSIYPMGKVEENIIWFTLGSNGLLRGGGTRWIRCLVELRPDLLGTLVSYSFTYSPRGKFLLTSIGGICLLMIFYFFSQHMWLYALFISPCMLAYPILIGLDFRKSLLEFLRKTLPPSHHEAS
jgi:hypothetical protein